MTKDELCELAARTYGENLYRGDLYAWREVIDVLRSNIAAELEAEVITYKPNEQMAEFNRGLMHASRIARSGQ